jgi:hypothetical protein
MNEKIRTFLLTSAFATPLLFSQKLGNPLAATLVQRRVNISKA